MASLTLFSENQYAVEWHFKHLPLVCGSSTPRALPVSLASGVPRTSKALACPEPDQMIYCSPCSGFLWHIAHLLAPINSCSGAAAQAGFNATKAHKKASPVNAQRNLCLFIGFYPFLF